MLVRRHHVRRTATTWLTQESYDRLSAELEELSGPARVDIAKKIEAAREEGDLKENGGYHAAKDEQGKIEARIRQLTELLRTATVGEPPESHGVVELGTVVTAKIAGDTDEVPARQPRDRRRRERHRRLPRDQPARPGHPRPEGRRQGQLHSALRQGDPRRDRRGRDLRGLTSPSSRRRPAPLPTRHLVRGSSGFASPRAGRR